MLSLQESPNLALRFRYKSWGILHVLSDSLHLWLAFLCVCCEVARAESHIRQPCFHFCHVCVYKLLYWLQWKETVNRMAKTIRTVSSWCRKVWRDGLQCPEVLFKSPLETSLFQRSFLCPSILRVCQDKRDPDVVDLCMVNTLASFVSASKTLTCGNEVGRTSCPFSSELTSFVGP